MHHPSTKEIQEFHKPLASVPDEDDVALHKLNCSTEMVTRRLRELIPLLARMEVVVVELGPEKTVLSLPLLASAMNQNGTHLAAVFYLLADYTFGIGMFGVLPGCCIAGIHDRGATLPVQYWVKQGTVHHLAPGTGRIRAEVCISSDDAQALRRQLIEKGRGELAGVVKIFQGNRIVAEAHHTMGINADVPRTAGVRASLFHLQNMKTSAIMTAGLREDSLSQQVAGDQGRSIASRMAVAIPQLPSLVKARTMDLERHLERAGQSYAQVLVIGIGLDPRPVRFSSDCQRWFGLDLRDMLKERDQRFSEAEARAQAFVPVIGDFLGDTWDAAIRQAGFSSDLPTLVIAEGLSMYFPREVLASFFSRLRPLVSSPSSRFWLDHLTPALFELDGAEIRSFLSSMARFGEPLVTGVDNPASIAPDSWILEKTTSASEALGLSDAIHAEYRFSVLKPLQDTSGPKPSMA